MLRLTDATYDDMVAHALDELPNEACGLVGAAPGTDKIERVFNYQAQDIEWITIGVRIFIVQARPYVETK